MPQVIYNLETLDGGHTCQIVRLLQELADASLIHDVCAELLPELRLDLRAQSAVPRGELLHQGLNMRASLVSGGRGGHLSLLVDFGGKHGPCPVLLIRDPHDALRESIRGSVIQILQQILQFCSQNRFGNCLSTFGRSTIVTFGGCWLGLSRPLLLKHEVDAAELLRAVHLI